METFVMGQELEAVSTTQLEADAGEPREMRLKLDLSITAAAAAADLAPNTYRLGEANRDALSPKARIKFEAFINVMRARLRQEAA